MDQAKVKVLKCNYGVTELSMSYLNGTDSFSHEIGGDELPHPDYVTNVSSGKLLLEKALKKRFETLSTELFLYFFENKTAQLEIDFKKEAANDK